MDKTLFREARWAATGNANKMLVNCNQTESNVIRTHHTETRFDLIYICTEKESVYRFLWLINHRNIALEGLRKVIIDVLSDNQCPSKLVTRNEDKMRYARWFEMDDET